MGDITDNIFEGSAKRGEARNLKRQAIVVKQEQELDDRKREFARVTAAQDAAVLDTADAEELGERLDSYLDSKRVGDAASGDSEAQQEDGARRQLDLEMGHYLRSEAMLKSRAVSAQGRLLGLLPRPTGYDGAASTGGESGSHSKGPILLGLAVFLVEWLQTSSWLSSNLSLWEASLEGTTRDVVVFGGSAVLTGIVMIVTYTAGRSIKRGMVARRAAQAEGVTTGQGGVLTPGIILGLLAVAFQTVTLGLRFATETGDESAQAGALVVGLVGFLGAAAVAGWEYASFQPAASAGSAVYTRQADTETIEEFRQAEYRRHAGIPLAKRSLQIEAMRRREKALERLQAAALDLESGKVQMTVLNARLNKERQEIANLYDKEPEYAAFDLEGAAMGLANVRQNGSSQQNGNAAPLVDLRVEDSTETPPTSAL